LLRKPLKKVILIGKTDVVNEELAGLADRVLNGDIKETIAGQRETITVDDPARAAFYATQRTEIYEEEPAEVLDYTGIIPDGEWREYHEQEDLDKVQAMAKASFEHRLYDYLVENYGETRR